MDHVITILEENFVMATIGGVILAGMALKSLTAILTTMSREKSRREIAAYIAEGSISAEQGERLMRADVNNGRGPANT
jgi:hypothetical protein